MTNHELIKKNKQRLEQERTRLEGLLSRVVDQNGQPKYPDFGAAEEDNAAEVAAYEANIAEEFDMEKKLESVKDALARIENGNYGVCEVGGEPIFEARLEAAPEAASCVEHGQAK